MPSQSSVPPATPAAPRLFEFRIALIYMTTLGANGISAPYFPLWLEHVRFDANAIALILAVPMFLRLVTTPMISSFADGGRDRATVLIACIGSSFLLALGYLLPPNFPLVLGISLALAVVWPPQTTVADAIALSGVRRFGAVYSRMRIWGSIAYVVANFAGGVILALSGTALMPALFAAAMGSAFVVSLFTPRLGSPQAGAAETETDTSLLRRPFFVLFVLAAGLIQGSHAFYYGFSSIFWTSLGLGKTVIGALWAFAVVAEVAVFMSFSRLFGRMTPVAILFASGAASILRWMLFPLVWPAGGGTVGFFAVQALHGISTGLMILGVQKMIGETVADRQTGSAQGFVFLASNGAIAVALLGSGWLYGHYGAGGFFVMALVAAAGLAFAWGAQRVQPQSAASGG